MAGQKSFAVEAWAGHWAMGWPFGRLDIGPAGLRVRSWPPVPWFRPRQAAKETIQIISVGRSRFNGCLLKIEDSAGCFSNVRVRLAMRPQRIIDELQRCGYPVADKDSGQEVTP
jgi:hypothetical protein